MRIMKLKKSGWVKERQRRYRIVINPFPLLISPYPKI
jgi:hypothetical protein